MQQNELAKLLGISPAMVSRLKKQGMPTDSLERAQRWRKRHLEPGRIKGSRFDPNQTSKPTAPKAAMPAPAAASAAAHGELLAEIEAAGVGLDDALCEGDQVWAEVMIQQVRDLLRTNTIEFDPDDKAEPRLSLRVWVALINYVLVLDGVIERATNPAELLTPIQFCQHLRPARPTYPLENHHTLSHACDWNDRSINGWPQYPEDDELDALALTAEA